jgi:hypothetical protein
MAEWANMCARATSRVDEYCNQVLRATLDTELCHGPDFRVTLGPGAGGMGPLGGNVRIILSRWPVLEVTRVQYCANGTWPRSWTTIPPGYAEPMVPPIGLFNSVAPSGDASGSQSILIAPGYINWIYGRNGYAIMVTYINGWPHASITEYTPAGSMTLPLDDCTGWALENYYGTYTGATGTIKDSGQQEAVHVTASSVTAGPGTVTLTAPTVYPHQAGTVVSTLPRSVEQACIYFATAEALTRGATSTTIHAVGGAPQSSGRGATSLIEEGELLIHAYRRVVLGRPHAEPVHLSRPRPAAGIDTLLTRMEQLMSEDAAVAAAAADLQTDAANLTTAVTALQGLITALQAEVASNPNVVQPATLTALQAAQAAVDAITGTASADVTADTPPVTA